MPGGSSRGHSPGKGQQDAALRRLRCNQRAPEVYARCRTCKAPYFNPPVVLGGITARRLHLCQACADKLFGAEGGAHEEP